MSRGGVAGGGREDEQGRGLTLGRGSNRRWSRRTEAAAGISRDSHGRSHPRARKAAPSASAPRHQLAGAKFCGSPSSATTSAPPNAQMPRTPRPAPNRA